MTITVGKALDCKMGDHGFDSQGQINTPNLKKKTKKRRYFPCPANCKMFVWVRWLCKMAVLSPQGDVKIMSSMSTAVLNNIIWHSNVLHFLLHFVPCLGKNSLVLCWQVPQGRLWHGCHGNLSSVTTNAAPNLQHNWLNVFNTEGTQYFWFLTASIWSPACKRPSSLAGPPTMSRTKHPPTVLAPPANVKPRPPEPLVNSMYNNWCEPNKSKLGCYSLPLNLL